MLEARVGRPTVSSECCFGMVMAMFYPSVEHAMTIFCVVSLSYNLIHVSVAGRGVQTARLNKRTGCESPRCRHCKCRDGLPLVKASHWRIPRRQTGRRSRHKSGDLRKPLESLNKSSSSGEKSLAHSSCRFHQSFPNNIPLPGGCMSGKKSKMRIRLPELPIL